MGETGGEMVRSCTLAGVEKEAEREWCGCWPELMWCAEEARPSGANSERVNLLGSPSVS